MTTLKFGGFWDWTGSISWNRVIDHRVLHQLTTFLLKAIYFNEEWNDLVCIRILQHSVELYNCTFMLSPAKWIKGRRRCWDRWTGWASKCRLRRGELWAWDQRRHKRMVEAKHLLPVWWDCGSLVLHERAREPLGLAFLHGHLNLSCVSKLKYSWNTI